MESRRSKAILITPWTFVAFATEDPTNAESSRWSCPESPPLYLLPGAGVIALGKWVGGSQINSKKKKKRKEKSKKGRWGRGKEYLLRDCSPLLKDVSLEPWYIPFWEPVSIIKHGILFQIYLLSTYYMLVMNPQSLQAGVGSLGLLH